MNRTLAMLASLICFAFPAHAQTPCGENAPAANAAIALATTQMENGDSEKAIAEAKRAVELDDTCFPAQLTLLRAYFVRFDYVEGLAALGISRKFRKQMKIVRTLRPNNIEARLMEISYLNAAPKIAGGNPAKARQLIEELETIDPAAAFRARLGLINTNMETSEIVSLLNDHVINSPEELKGRIWASRILILAKKEYRLADQELASLDQIALPEDAKVERFLLRGVLRVRGEFDYEEAENFLNEFVNRRPALRENAMEPLSIGYAYLGDARRLAGNEEGARTAYEAALARDPTLTRAQTGLAQLN